MSVADSIPPLPRPRAIALAALACWCASSGCNRGASLDTSDAATDDVVDAAPGENLVPDETIAVAPGLTMELYRDLSDDIVVSDTDFVDTDPISNLPTDLAYMERSPSKPGLAVVAGRSIFEVPEDGSAVVEHDFTPAAPDGTGPDSINACATAMLTSTGAGLRCTTASLNAGDGVYHINANWDITRTRTTNNCSAPLLDPIGRFDQIGEPAEYHSCSGTLQQANGTILADGLFESLTVLASGDILGVDEVVNGSETFALVRIGSLVHDRTFVANYTRLTLAEGALPPEPDLSYGLFEERQLVIIGPDGALRPLATTEGPWRWLAVVIPRGESKHLFVLEVDEATNRERILETVVP